MLKKKLTLKNDLFNGPHLKRAIEVHSNCAFWQTGQLMNND